MTCDNCGQPCEASATSCPYCRASTGGGLARVAATDALDRSVADALLARFDAGVDDLLDRDLGGALALDELRAAVARVDRSDPTVAELERSLTDEAALALDGIALSGLIDPRGADRKIVQRGLALLKRGLWSEALEWWSLHRASLDPSRERFALLLLLLEAFTYRLAGDPRRAAEARARAAAHPLYRAARGRART
jgi:hypothetical protein